MKNNSYYDILSICSLILTFITFILFESTRNIYFVPIGIISFTVFAYWITNRITILERYSDMIFPFIVGMLIFMLFIEDFGEIYNPFNDFNELLLSSQLADIQIILATIFSVNIANWFWLLNLLLFGILLTNIFLKHKQRTFFRMFASSQEKLKNKDESLSLFLNIIALASILGLIITFFGFLIEGVGYSFSFTFTETSGSNLYYGRITFPMDSAYPSSVTLDSRCSGIHSFIIFISCFYLTFLYIGRNSNPKKLLITLIVGTIGTFIGNWLRVVAVLLTGYYLGGDPMFFVHEYAGLIIFLGFMLVFWSISLDYLLEDNKLGNKLNSEEN